MATCSSDDLITALVFLASLLAWSWIAPVEGMGISPPPAVAGVMLGVV